MIRGKIIRFLIFVLCTGIFPLEDIILPLHPDLQAQIRRRREKTPKKKSTSSKSTKTTSAASSAELEARNRELLKQIVDLQNERDFYKKKLLEWSEAQKKGEQKSAEQVQPADLSNQPAVSYPAKARGRVDTVFIKAKPETVTVRLKPEYSYEDSLLSAGLQALRRKEFVKSGEIFTILVNSPGCQDKHYYQAGLVSWRVLKFRDALSRFQRVVQNDNFRALASFFRGRIFQKMGNLQAARIEFERCRRFASSMQLHSLGTVFEKIGKSPSDSLLMVLNQLPDLPPEAEAEKWLAVGMIFTKEGDENRSVSAFQAAVASDPYNLDNLEKLAELSLKAGYYQAAAEFFSEIAAYRKDDQHILFSLAKSKYFLRDWDGALSCFLRLNNSGELGAVRKEWLPKVYYLKSLAARERSDFQQANTFFRRALNVDPNSGRWMQEALQDLATIYEMNSRDNAALKTYSNLIRLGKEDPETFLKMGVLYYKSGDLQEARIAFEKASRSQETQPEAFRWLSIIQNSISSE